MSRVLVFLVLGTVACGAPTAAVTEARTLHLPARAANCTLEFLQQSFDYELLQTWELVGSISFSNTNVPDPMAEENRALARPRACAMGGWAILIGPNTSTIQAGRQGSAVMYLVLRRKPTTPDSPTTF